MNRVLGEKLRMDLGYLIRDHSDPKFKLAAECFQAAINEKSSKPRS